MRGHGNNLHPAVREKFSPAQPDHALGRELCLDGKGPDRCWLNQGAFQLAMPTPRESPRPNLSFVE